MSVAMDRSPSYHQLHSIAISIWAYTWVIPAPDELVGRLNVASWGVRKLSMMRFTSLTVAPPAIFLFGVSARWRWRWPRLGTVPPGSWPWTPWCHVSCALESSLWSRWPPSHSANVSSVHWWAATEWVTMTMTEMIVLFWPFLTILWNTNTTPWWNKSACQFRYFWYVQIYSNPNPPILNVLQS